MSTDHEHHHDDHDREQQHDEHGHVHTARDWRAELEAVRHAAGHYYEHQFDWRGHGPPQGFAGPRFYPPTTDWRLEGQLDAEVPGAGSSVTLATSTGQLRQMVVAGQVVFTVDGGEHRLTAFRTHDAEGYDLLFVPFRDLTSGGETYGAGRYLEIPYEPDRGVVELDFNYAYNPSCVYSPAYDCPYPPPANRLDLHVRAGEMMPSVKVAE